MEAGAVMAEISDDDFMAMKPASGLMSDDDFVKAKPSEGGNLSRGLVNAGISAITGGMTPPAPKEQFEGLDWSQVPEKAIQNIPKSAIQFGHDIVQPFVNPIDTGMALKDLGFGVIQKLAKVGALPTQPGHVMDLGSEYEKHADAVGKHLVDRYGSMEAIKNTLANDPVGIAADVATVLSGGELAAARAPGVIGQTGRAMGTMSRAIDPLSAVGAAVKGAGHVAAAGIGELGTHTGYHSVRTAAEAGAEGGHAAEAFQSHMRGTALQEEVVNEARQAVRNMKITRGNAYKADKALIDQDKTILSFNDIDAAINAMEDVSKYRGVSKAGPGIELSESTAGMRQKMVDTVEMWKNQKASEFWTVEGFDALKKALGDIRDSTAYGTPARKIADEIYHSARDTIVKQAPGYAKLMSSYEKASDIIRQIETTLRTNPKASIDSSLRSLQSVFRNNVNTSYGYRKHLAQFLVQSGAPNLMEKLAGQAMSAPAPRGLGRLGAQVGMELILASLGHMAHGMPGSAMALVAATPFMSPRLVGEGAHYAGKASRLPLRGAARAGYQIGRESEKSGPPSGWPSMSPWGIQ